MTYQNSKRLFFALLLRNLPLYGAIAGLLWWGTRPFLGFIPRKWVIAFFVAFVFLSFYLLIQVILTQRLNISSDKLKHSKGFIIKSTVESDLDQVTSVHVDRPWNLRILGLAKVVISLKGTATSLSLEGLKLNQAWQLSGLVESQEDSKIDVAKPGNNVSTITPAKLVFNLSLRESAASFLGSFPFVLAAVIAAVSILADMYERLNIVRFLNNQVSLAALLIGTAVLIIGVTAIIGYVTIHNFSLTKGNSGEWKIRYGLFEIQERSINKSGASSLRVTVSLADALFHTARARIGIGDPLQGGDRQFHFPSLQFNRITALADELFGNQFINFRTKPLHWILYLSFLATGATVAITLGHSYGYLRYGLLAAVTWLILVPLFISVTSTEVQITSPSIMQIRFWRYGFVTDFIPLSAVSTVKYVGIPYVSLGILQIGAYTQKTIWKISFTQKSTYLMVLNEVTKRNR